jgi:hypothetical protein
MTDMSDTLLVRVVAPHFVAGLIMQGDKCIQAAPILKWCRGACRATLSAEFRRKGWVATVLR